ncbi:MAG: exo-beta-N-acetylmuramidase NamZ domain-containing protein [Sumerlaeia bacterium]
MKLESQNRLTAKAYAAIMLCIVLLAGCSQRTPISSSAVDSPTAQTVLTTEASAPEKQSNTPSQPEKKGPEPSVFSLTLNNRMELSPNRKFSLGLDQLVREDYARLNHKRICVVTSRLALDSNGEHLLETLLPKRNPIVTRVVLLDDELPSPARSDKLNSLLAAYPEIRIFGLSANNPSITDVMLQDTEVVLLDLPYRGLRTNPEFALLGSVMLECHAKGLKMLVLDRPIAISGGLTSGPTGKAEDFTSTKSFFPVPIIPGLTLAEFARMYNREYGLAIDLEVISLLFWNRFTGFAQLMSVYEEKSITPWVSFEEWDQYYSTNQRLVELQLTQELLPGIATISQSEGVLEIAAPENAEELLKVLKENTSAYGVVVSLKENLITLENPKTVNPVELSFAIILAMQNFTEEPIADQFIEGLAAQEYSAILKSGANVQQIRQAWSQSDLHLRFTLKRQGYFLSTGQ